jgi:hypothetical protein
MVRGYRASNPVLVRVRGGFAGVGAYAFNYHGNPRQLLTYIHILDFLNITPQNTVFTIHTSIHDSVILQIL